MTQIDAHIRLIYLVHSKRHIVSKHIKSKPAHVEDNTVTYILRSKKTIIGVKTNIALLQNPRPFSYSRTDLTYISAILSSSQQIIPFQVSVLDVGQQTSPTQDLVFHASIISYNTRFFYKTITTLKEQRASVFAKEQLEPRPSTKTSNLHDMYNNNLHSSHRK